MTTEFILRLFIAGILGSIIGLDREYRAKEAGYRTHFLVSLGSALIMIVLGLVFMVQLNYLLGLLTLKYQGIGTFLMIKNNLMELVTGSIVPLALFPEVFFKLMKCLPFYYVTYLPSMLLTGKCEQEAMTGIVILGCWCLIIQVMIGYVWKTYIRKYDGVGI